MNRKKYNQIRAVVALFISFIVSIATTQGSYLLAVTGVVTGMIFLLVVRSKTKISVDEREKTVREKAAHLTYAIFAPTIGIGSFLLMIPAQSNLSVFSGANFTYLESLGTVLAYLTLYLMALYAICFHFLNKKFGGSSDQE